jgi:Tfp pilus assembly protein PilN
MPFINLIQEQRLAAKRLEQQTRISFFSFAGAAVAVVGAYGFLLFNSSNAASEEARLRGERQKLEPSIGKIEQNRKDLAALQPRLKTLEDAQTVSTRWARLLDHLKFQTPKDTWLTAMRSTAADPAKPITVTFAGMGFAQDPIAEFILRMQNAQDIENVNLVFTNEKMIQQTRAIEFQVSGDIVGTAEQKAKDKTDEEKA